MPTQKLLPLISESGHDQTSTSVAFNLKIPLELQQKLINSGSKLKIIVSKGELQLNINGQLYKLNKLQEFSKVDLYKQFSSSTYRSIGSIHSKLTLSQTPHTNETSISSKVPKSYTPPLHNTHLRNRSNGSNTLIASGTKISAITKKLVHLLALGPISIEEMVQRTKVPKADIESVLRSISMIYSPDQGQKNVIQKYPHDKEFKNDEKLYVLNYSNYKELKLNDWKYSDNELKQIKENCKLVYDHLNYSNSHPARLALSPKPETPKPLDQPETPVVEVKKPIETKKQQPIEPIDSKNEKFIQHKIEENPVDKKEVKKLTESIEMIPKKRKRQDDNNEEYLQDLAKRFKTKYKEYETLYKEISINSRLQKSSQTNNNNNNNNHHEELKKLYEMHKDLELWKKQLWNSVKSTPQS